MLADYIPVYWPEHNKWSIPVWEIDEYVDYVDEPQDMKLRNGAVVRGIPLLHFGTWGMLEIKPTDAIRWAARDPKGFCEKWYSDETVKADVAGFFARLAKKYPKIAEVERMTPEECGGTLRVPEDCVVKRGKE